MTVDHEEIRRWAEERGAHPASVRGTGGGADEAGIIRIDFPGYSGEGTLEPISWDEFFDKFEESHLALVYQESTARGQKSNFNKLVSRESVDLETQDSKAAPPRRRRTQAAAGRGGTAKRATRKAAPKRATGEKKSASRGELRAPRTGTSGRTARKGAKGSTSRGGGARAKSPSRGKSSSRGKAKR